MKPQWCAGICRVCPRSSARSRIFPVGPKCSCALRPMEEIPCRLATDVPRAFVPGLRALAALVLSAFAMASVAQIPRERANPGAPVDELFWAPNVVVTGSVTNLARGDLNFTIMHSFGVVSSGADDLFGLDAAANIRFGFDYGVTDRISIGVGRSRFDKLWDLRTKVNVLRQRRDDAVPVEVAVKADVAVETMDDGLDFQDRLSYFATLMLARKFSERISLQISPMLSHFNTVFVQPGPRGEILEEENTHFAVGLQGRLLLQERVALLLEYIPVFGERSDGTTDAFSVGLDLETGGHVFQLFFTTSQWLTEQHMIARNVDRFFDGDFRFGFNVNRVFGVR